VGNIIALSLGGLLCVYGIDGGWPSIFYLFGGCGVAWSIIFFLLSADEPSAHWFIRPKEKEYVIRETKKTIELKKYCQQV
jgi:MFS family permease